MHKQIVFFLAVSEEFLSLIPFANYPFTLYKLEIRVSQNLAKVGGGGGGGPKNVRDGRGRELE